MAHEIHAWLADREGFLIGEIDAPTSNDDWDTFVANALANGHTAIAKGDDPEATKPPLRPLTPEQQQRADKSARLQELRAKGWSNLTDAEKAEADSLKFDLGLS